MVTVYIDGGSRGNPGPAAIGIVVFDKNGSEVYRYGKKVGNRTNNFAEYQALLEACKYIKKHGSQYNERVIIYSDSKLLVNQMNNRYRVKSPLLLPLFKKARKMVKKSSDITIQYISRNDNRIADWIVNRVLDKREY